MRRVDKIAVFSDLLQNSMRMEIYNGIAWFAMAVGSSCPRKFTTLANK